MTKLPAIPVERDEGVQGSGFVPVGTPKPAPMINSITSLRFFCALYVFIFHFEIRMPLMPGVLKNIALNGYTGMSCFFILSGFVLTIRYWDERLSYGKFMTARLARIYPAFMAAFMLSFPAAINHIPVPSAASLIFSTLSNVVLLQSWFPNLNPLGINGGTWSLSVEMFFYLMFPLLLVPLRKAARPSVRFLCGAAVALWLASFLPGLCQLILPMKGAPGFYYSTPIYRFPEFIFGIVAAYSWKQGYIKGRPWPALPLAAIYIFVSSRYAGMGEDNLTILNFVVVPLVGIILIYAAEARPKLLEWRPLVYLGDISYGIYMYQFVFIEYLFPKLRAANLHPVVVAAIGLFVTLSLAALSYRFFETPVRVYTKKRMGRSVDLPKPHQENTC